MADADIVFGASVRHLWSLEPDMVFLNHGSYGATPLPVQEAQRRLQARLEAQPCRFINSEAPALIRAAADRLAAFVGTTGGNIGFCENATSGINAILRSLRFQAGDVVVVTDHIYNAVRQTLTHVLAASGAAMRVVDIPVPVEADTDIAAIILAAVDERTRLVMVDHVASVSAMVFPVGKIVADAATETCRCWWTGRTPRACWRWTWMRSTPTGMSATATNGCARRRAPRSCAFPNGRVKTCIPSPSATTMERAFPPSSI